MSVVRNVIYVLFSALLFGISGCAGVQYTDKVQAVDISQLDKKETTTRVLANADEWRNSGSIVRKGVKYRIAATGNWTAGPICGFTGPDGLGVSPICSGAAGTYIGKGSASLLLGKVGDQGEPFSVGNGLELTSEENDILFFRINDTPMWMGDNSGYVYVTTSLISPVAEQQVKPIEERPVAKVVFKGPVSEEKLPPLRPDTYAVIIGIDYKNRQDMPNLQYASQDAKKVYDILIDPRYGGVPKENAVLLLNEKATRNEMVAALHKVKTWDGYVYVYYSGHGAPKIKEDKMVDGFLVPSDIVITDPDTMEDTGIKVSFLRNLVDTSHAKGVMVALDACFTGGGKSIVPQGGKPLVGMLINQELMGQAGAGKVIITSSASNQQSWEDEKELKSGIFSYYLLEGLRGKSSSDVWVKVDELAEYVKDNVVKAARKLKGIEQTPQIAGKADFAVSRNWERSKVMDIETARVKLKGAFERGSITIEQLNRVLDEIKGLTRSKTLDAFLSGKIDEKRFGELY